MALPERIQTIVALIGHGRAMDLVREFGGQEIKFPAQEGNDTWAALVEVIGEAATRKLAAVFGGGQAPPVYIARCAAALRDDRNRRMIARHERLLNDGHTSRGAVSILVREHHLSYRQVENILNAPTPQPSGLERQRGLF